jgi:Zn-dependent protease/CBS domain-containing protein
LAVAPAKGWRLQVVRAFGIPVYLHFSWVIVFGLIASTLATGYFPTLVPDLPWRSYWLLGLLASLLLFASILVHEMAHAVVARAAGLEIRSITLFLFGGVAEMAQDPEDGRTELRIAVAGPLVSFALAALFGLAAASSVGLPPALRSVSRYLAWLNVLIAVFNLVPAFPLDGGRILRGLLWRSMGRTRATRAAALAGSAFALFLTLSGVFALLNGLSLAGIWYIALGWFLQQASGSAHDRARLDEMLGGITVREIMLSQVETLPADITLAEASQHFIRSGYGSYPVSRGDVVVGLLCLRDLLRIPAARRAEVPVQSAMRPLSPAIVVGPAEPLLTALAKVAQGDAGRLLVLDEDRLVGLVTMSAVLRQVAVRQKLAA